MSEPSNLTAWERWELASFDAPAVRDDTPSAAAEEVRLPTAAEIEQIHPRPAAAEAT